MDVSIIFCPCRADIIKHDAPTREVVLIHAVFNMGVTHWTMGLCMIVAITFTVYLHI